MLEVFGKPASPTALSIIILAFISSAISSSPEVATLRRDGPRSHYWQDEDYENLSYEPTSSTAPTAESPVPRCKYDPCLDQQEPCRLIAAARGCSCPGTSGPHNPPEAPYLHRLWRGHPGGVMVHWCAPASDVTSYHVRVEGQPEQWKLGERSRLLDLGEVAAGAEVCVQAVNRAGASAPERRSCGRFEPRTSESGLALKLGILGGVVVLVAVLALALVLYRLRKRRDGHARAETGGAGGGEVL